MKTIRLAAGLGFYGDAWAPVRAAIERIIDTAARELGFDLVAVGPAGPPEHGAALRARVSALGLDRRVRFLRAQPQRRLRLFYAAASATARSRGHPVMRVGFQVAFHEIVNRGLRRFAVWTKNHGVKRLGKPEEFASLAMELVRNSYFNGQAIRLDGAIRMAPR